MLNCYLFLADDEYTIPELEIENCGVNEFFTECGGCDETCSSKIQPCTRNCRVGCYCETGYVRNARKQCILKSDCGPDDVTDSSDTPVITPTDVTDNNNDSVIIFASPPVKE